MVRGAKCTWNRSANCSMELDSLSQCTIWYSCSPHRKSLRLNGSLATQVRWMECLSWLECQAISCRSRRSTEVLVGAVVGEFDNFIEASAFVLLQSYLAGEASRLWLFDFEQSYAPGFCRWTIRLGRTMLLCLRTVFLGRRVAR